MRFVMIALISITTFDICAADSTYHFVQALVARGHLELAQRMVDSAPKEADAWDLLMLRATVLRARAARSIPAERLKLERDAENAYSKFLDSAPDVHRLRDEAMGEAAAFRLNLVERLANLDTHTPQDLEFQAELARGLAKSVAQQDAAAKAAWPPFKKQFDEYVKFATDKPDAPLPAGMRGKLEETFMKWLAADKAWTIGRIALMASCPAGSTQQKQLLSDIVVHCTVMADHDAFNETPLHAASYLYLGGHAFLLAGDLVSSERMLHDARSMADRMADR